MRRFFGAGFLAFFLVGVIGCGNAGQVSSDAVDGEFSLVDLEGVEAVGFDIDDTLLFSSPAFDLAFASDHEAFSPEFWSLVNESDRGRSCIKPVVLQAIS